MVSIHRIILIPVSNNSSFKGGFCLYGPAVPGVLWALQ